MASHPQRCATRARASLFISHRFDEVFSLCDTVTVMRDGGYVSTDRIDERHRRRDHAPDGRAATSGAVPQAADRAGERRARGRADSPAPASSTTSASPCGPARSSASPGSSVRAGPRSPARSSASTVRLRLRAPRRPGAAAQPARSRWSARLGLVPEDRRKQGLVIDDERQQNITLAIRAVARVGRLAHRAAENESAPTWARRLAGEDRGARHRGRDAQRRQPAEGRPRQVAARPSRRCSSSTSRPAASTSVPRPRSTGCSPSWPPGHGHPHDLLRTARGARHGRPRPGHARGPPDRGVPRAEATAEAVMFAATDETEAPVTTDRRADPGANPVARVLTRRVLRRARGILIALILVILVATIRNHASSSRATAAGSCSGTPTILHPHRGRRGDRDHHPQRRPLRRIHPRPDHLLSRGGSSTPSRAYRLGRRALGAALGTARCSA